MKMVPVGWSCHANRHFYLKAGTVAEVNRCSLGSIYTFVRGCHQTMYTCTCIGFISLVCSWGTESEGSQQSLRSLYICCALLQDKETTRVTLCRTMPSMSSEVTRLMLCCGLGLSMLCAHFAIMIPINPIPQLSVITLRILRGADWCRCHPRSMELVSRPCHDGANQGPHLAFVGRFCGHARDACGNARFFCWAGR